MNVTEEAEWAAERLVARLAEYLQIAQTGGVSPLDRGRHTPSQIQPHDANALVDLVAVAESFCVNRLLRVRALDPDVLSTWDKRRKAWSKEASVNLDDFEDWDKLRGFVETRNALQHGLGRLTDRQLGKHKQEVLSWLDAADVQRNGDVLVLSHSDVERCATVCRAFVEWLDSAAPPRLGIVRRG